MNSAQSQQRDQHERMQRDLNHRMSGHSSTSFQTPKLPQTPRGAFYDRPQDRDSVRSRSPHGTGSGPLPTAAATATEDTRFNDNERTDAEVNELLEEMYPEDFPDVHAHYALVVHQLNGALHQRETEVSGLDGRPEKSTIHMLHLPPTCLLYTSPSPRD